MNPWHSTDPTKPCVCEGCTLNWNANEQKFMGHQPAKGGDFWYVLRLNSTEQTPLTLQLYDGNGLTGWHFCDAEGDTLVLPKPTFYRTPDGHPPIPEDLAEVKALKELEGKP